MIRVGTSGWQYDDWRGPFYPERLARGAWLAYLAQRFPTVEVNSTFYRLPAMGTFARWRAETPEGFTFAVKASRFITHVRRLRDCRGPVELLWDRVSELGPRLGPVLFQLPPTLRVAPDLLAGFVALLPRRMRAAFEFRHPSWRTVAVREILDAAGAALVMADTPGARVPDLVTGGWAYVRFHQGRADEPGYAAEKLHRWARRIDALPARDVFAYFNNDAGAAAIRDAGTLTRMLADAAPQGGSAERGGDSHGRAA